MLAAGIVVVSKNDKASIFQIIADAIGQAVASPAKCECWQIDLAKIVNVFFPFRPQDLIAD